MTTKIKLFVVLTLIAFSISLVSCYKSPGAICNDGSRSYSKGRGTCSWHGGVRYYVNTDEISIPKTTGLLILIGLAGRIYFDVKEEK